MEIVYERCCGLDIHKSVVVACVNANGRKEIQSSGAMTDNLLELCGWLKTKAVANGGDGKHRLVLEADF